MNSLCPTEDAASAVFTRLESRSGEDAGEEEEEEEEGKVIYSGGRAEGGGQHSSLLMDPKNEMKSVAAHKCASFAKSSKNRASSARKHDRVGMLFIVLVQNA